MDKTSIILKFNNQMNYQKSGNFYILLLNFFFYISEPLSSLPLQISISCHIALYLPLLISQIICFLLKVCIIT